MAEIFLEGLRGGSHLIDAGGGEACGAAHAGGVVEHHKTKHGSQGKQGPLKALNPTEGCSGAGEQGRVARGHATGFHQHPRIPAAMHHQLNHQLGELGNATGRQAPPEHAVIEDANQHGVTHRSRLVM